MSRKIKFWLWTIFPVILGILVAHFAFSFFEKTEYIQNLEITPTNENSVTEKKPEVKQGLKKDWNVHELYLCTLYIPIKGEKNGK